MTRQEHMENLFNTHEKLDENTVILGYSVRLISDYGYLIYYHMKDIDKIQKCLKSHKLDTEWEITVETFKQPFKRKLVLHRK